MKSIFKLLYLFAFIISATALGADVKKYSLKDFMENKKYVSISFASNDSKILLSSDQSGIFNGYSLTIADKTLLPLTESDKDSFYTISYFKTDERAILTSSAGESGKTHLFVRDLDGTLTDITPYENSFNTFLGWSEDGKSFFILSNFESKFQNIYKVSTTDFVPKLFYKNTDGYRITGLNISNDQRYLALWKMITISQTELFIFDRTTGDLKQISPPNANATYTPTHFSPDSKSLFYITNQNGDFGYLREYDIKSGQSKEAARRSWDIVRAGQSKSGKYLYTISNEDARNILTLYNWEKKIPIALPTLPPGFVTDLSISDSEKYLAFYYTTDKSPSDLYLYELTTSKLEKLTTALNPAINIDDLVESKVIRFASFDGTFIPALFFKPNNIKPNQQVPALIWVHGGPGGQTVRTYNELFQYLLNNGYAILAVNNRGSSGYGKRFYEMADRKHGDVDLKDCIEAKKYLASTGIIDTDKIGIMGASYGGYITLAALAFYPNEMAVGIDIFGVSNWVRTLENVPKLWESFKEALFKKIGHPVKDKEYLRSISPLFYINNITKPLMVIQGANDIAVIQVESDEVVAGLRKNKVPCEYILFPDEGHGITKKSNSYKAYNGILKFLNTYLPIN